MPRKSRGVLQINAENGEILMRFKSIYLASKFANISQPAMKERIERKSVINGKKYVFMDEYRKNHRHEEHCGAFLVEKPTKRALELWRRKPYSLRSINE